MTKKEFISLCVSCGYCRKRTAEEFAKGKCNLTERDLVDAYRAEQEAQSKREADRVRFESKRLEGVIVG